MHVEQEEGPLAHNIIQIRLPITDVKYDPGFNIVASESYIVTYKYNQHDRFCLGVTKVQLMNGEVEGKRYDVFVYNGKCILTIEDFNKRVKDEVKRTRELTSDSHST